MERERKKGRVIQGKIILWALAFLFMMDPGSFLPIVTMPFICKDFSRTIKS